MDIKTLRTSFVHSLSEIYDQEEVLSFFYMLSEKILGLQRVHVAVHLDRILSNDEIVSFDTATKRLENQEPIQYILGKTEFYGLPFLVNQHVLIPRPETEELVDWIVKDQINKKDPLKILDIGTGSGCIAVSLAKNLPEAEVYAIDISGKAIEVAKENAEKNGVAIVFMQLDILIANKLPQKFDIIVSNPPYVRASEKQEMKPNVLDNEPLLALFVSDNDPLVFYEKITELAIKCLKPSGALYYEINQYLGSETKHMIKAQGFESVVVRKDIYNNERMIKARLN